ncbi:hypothetical protein [Actinosynnema sp. ALI-1.44]|uniref:hypothetical protein n=1 Tax=Actinosynnema sp. ALI-1.44 TaxID=1933779 RepID=UPI000A0623CD|nr:hypothetical protein [Actinosynnema sp. ALI-1.44]
MRKLRTTAIAVAGLMVMTLGTVPTATADDTAKKLNAADYKLVRTANDADYNKLVGALPNADVKAVLDDSNREAVRIPKEDGQHITPNFAAGFLWKEGDDNTTEWRPQGITTSSDALDEGVWQDRKVVLVSWYGLDGSEKKGARISFIDRTDPLKPVYRHVLLVRATTKNGHPDFESTNPNHAGGLAWYGNLLYVASTDNIEVYDLNDILKVSTANDSAIGRAANGDYHAYGYQYVIPTKFSYNRATPSQNIRFSAISLDRSTSPDSMLVTEWDPAGDGTRLFRWDVNYETRELSDVTADWAYQVNIKSMQGAAAIKGGDGPDKSWYYISRSTGDDSRGDLIVWQPGKLANIYQGEWPIGPEDMAYRPSTDEMWTVAEYANNRYVMSVTADRFHP